MNKTSGKILGAVVSPRGANLGLLLLRLVAGGMMLTHGIQKLINFSSMAAGFPDMLGMGAEFSFTLIMLAEFAGSILLIFGLLTRLSALSLAIGMSVAAFVAHAPFTLSGSELPLLYLGVFVVLLVTGSGLYSVDHFINKYVAASRRQARY